ncbi:MAG: YDG domain-containing protein [Candidatus Omnitrophota bacterium]
MRVDDSGSWIQTFDDKNSGVGKTLTPAGTVDDGNNYDVTFVKDTIGEITGKPLSVAGITAANKVYDGTTTAMLYGTGALDGVVSPDDVTLDTAGATGAFEDSSVGAGKTVTITGLTLGDANVSNYELATPQATATADITAVNTSSNFINSLLSNGGSIYFIPPDAGSFGQFQFNTFNPLGGTVYFYHPLTPIDLSAFESLNLGDDAYQFIGGAINIIGHDEHIPFLMR